jgi:sensor domain CHASE-containing protein
VSISLRWRVVVVVAAVTALALAALLVFDRVVLLQSFQAVESAEVRRDVDRVVHGIRAESDRLDLLAVDWASWNDSYEFMDSRSPAFVASNLPPGILASLDLAAIVFLDPAGHVVLSRAALPDDTTADIPELTPANSMSRVADVLARVKEDGRAGGVIRTGEGPALLVVARPILRSDETGAPRGSLIFARWLDAAHVEKIASQLATPVEFLTPAEVPDGVIGSDASRDSTRITRENGLAMGYGVVRDIVGQPAIVVRTSQVRGVGDLANSTSRELIVIVAAFGALMAAALVVALQLTVLRPMRRLERQLATIDGGRVDARVA